MPQGRDLLKELLLFGWERGVQIDFEVVGPTRPRPGPVGRSRPWYAVTLLGHTL